jgi:hypothetical protein
MQRPRRLGAWDGVQDKLNVIHGQTEGGEELAGAHLDHLQMVGRRRGLEESVGEEALRGWRHIEEWKCVKPEASTVTWCMASLMAGPRRVGRRGVPCMANTAPPLSARGGAILVTSYGSSVGVDFRPRRPSYSTLLKMTPSLGR